MGYYPAIMSTVNVTFKVSGMHCSGCVKRVTAALAAIDGVDDLIVEVGTASFTSDDDAVDEAAAAVVGLGFAVDGRTIVDAS